MIMKAPNDMINIEDFPFHKKLLASPKLDGNRCMCIGGELRTSRWKHFPNKKLYEYLSDIIRLCKIQGLVLDGELFDTNFSHHAKLSGILNASNSPIPSSVVFFVFDGMSLNDWETNTYIPFADRLAALYQYSCFKPMLVLNHSAVANRQELQVFYEHCLRLNYEGVIVRSYYGYYKHGRATLNDGIIWKLKPIHTFDGKIIGIIPRRKLKKNIERELDELGYMKHVYKQDYYDTTPVIGSFIVLYNGNKTCKVGFGKGFSMEDRRKLFEEYPIGRHIEFKFLDYGKKDKPRHAQLVRFREDLDASTGN